MSKAIVLDSHLKEKGSVELPKRYESINSHNLYLYVKHYLSSVRANTAKSKNRAEVSGGGRKPWAQKGGGRARAGSITSPVFVGGGVSHGATNKRNYNLKINKKQKRLALEYALEEKAQANKLFVVEKIAIKGVVEDNKRKHLTKEANQMFQALEQRDTLFVCMNMDEYTELAFSNLKKCLVIDVSELNAYLLAAFSSVVMEEAAFQHAVQDKTEE
ncbi:50S ribosomal protein L4 [Helicobacter pylori]|uniref:50S ribosomal protein L4 n=1 Tax=Helicobacter pylori TaxID=210 RepID=UPI00165CA239|nr:50S ribosomal protein L4 [Helicobacter pylori]MBH0252255.1 50S ribosomal protein L4 [Helicobacter pylori]WRF33930.1 50S ribosomal protein L4 [Helicobacter pylori]